MRRDIGTSWNRVMRNNLNNNFIELFNKYSRAGKNASEALQNASESLGLSERTQKELSEAILAGDSSPLAGQLKVGADSTIYKGPQERLVAEHTILTEDIKEDREVEFMRDNNNVKRSHPNGVKKCVVSFIDDDGYNLSFEKLRPILEPLNVPISMALCPEFTDSGKQITKENIEIAKELGWEFASHTLSHRRLPDLPLSEVDYELRESKRRIEELTNQPIEYFVYPHNHQNYDIRQIVKRYYKYAFYGNNKIVDYPARSMQIERVSMGAFQSNSGVPDTLEYYKSMFDEAYEKGRWIVFMLHAFHEEFDETQQQHLKDLINYIRSKNVSIKVPSEAWADMGNMVNIGDGDFENFVITNRGEMYGSSKDRENTQMGYLSQVDRRNSSAYGYLSKALGNESTAVGIKSHSLGGNSSAFGDSSIASGARSVALGVNSEANNNDSFSGGYASLASGVSSTAIGHLSKSNKDRSTAVGNNSFADGAFSTAVGVSAKATGARSIALGVDAESSAVDSTSTGHVSKASGVSSTANGYRTRAVGNRSTAVGNDALAGDINTTALGVSSRATGPHSVAIGKDAHANAFSSIALGNSAKAGDTSIALGNSSESLGSGATSLGDATKAKGANSVAIGRGAKADNDNDFVLGGDSHKVIIPSNEIYLRSPSGFMKIISVTDDGNINVRNP